MLANAIDWQEACNIILPDLKKTTPKGFWNRGRPIQLRTHLGVFLLQAIYNLSDRATEAYLKENAAAQLFAGSELVENWNPPDHTKIETFRSRLSAETQRMLANLTAKWAVKEGLGDSSTLDVDSTIQSANVAYPTDIGTLFRFGVIARRLSAGLKEMGFITRDFIEDIGIRNIKSKVREYFFAGKKKDSGDIKKNILKRVKEEIEQSVIPLCFSQRVDLAVTDTPPSQKNATRYCLPQQIYSFFISSTILHRHRKILGQQNSLSFFKGSKNFQQRKTKWKTRNWKTISIRENWWKYYDYREVHKRRDERQIQCGSYDKASRRSIWERKVKKFWCRQGVLFQQKYGFDLRIQDIRITHPKAREINTSWPRGREGPISCQSKSWNRTYDWTCEKRRTVRTKSNEVRSNNIGSRIHINLVSKSTSNYQFQKKRIIRKGYFFLDNLMSYRIKSENAITQQTWSF
jgi:hypothetical protein